ncbi:hypothetical protein LNP05_10860 [Klebsiella pneumoniae subsp. pneumoniae]|nr:hypothetical protein [Klebsiella pneumoniae subsp. pneumoniae]
MKGWLGKYQDMGVAIYLTPDGKHAISGYMYDENGSNLSEQLFPERTLYPGGTRDVEEDGQRPLAAGWSQGRPIVLYMSLPIPSVPTASSSGSNPAPG